MKRVMTRRVSSWMTRGRSRPGCRRSISSSSAATNGTARIVGELEQAGAQAVVDVVRVVGDVVGDRRRLRLEAGVLRQDRRFCRRS